MKLKLKKLLFIYSFCICLYSTAASVLDNKIDSEPNDLVDNSQIETTKYEPNWESLDARPLPQWYDNAKVGIFIHWGVFSVPSFRSEWFWKYWQENNPEIVNFMTSNYPPGFTYQDFGHEFTASFYNATQWVELFKKAGARYVVLTSKHHEGFTNWPSKYAFGWNSVDIGPKRDLVGELAAAVKAAASPSSKPFHFGLYHSQFEFFNPLYLSDEANSFKTDTFARFKSVPELYELVKAYQPEVIWSDGDGGAPPEYWKSQEFLAWLYNESPVKDTVVVNDRWGKGTSCKHGGFYNCADRYNPYKLQSHKWENCFTLDKGSWGYRREARLFDYLTKKEVISLLVTTVSCGGNVLINIGPTKDGTIAPIMEERLLQLGGWLDVNGDAIYESTPWLLAQNDSTSGFVWYTTKPSLKTIYGIVLQDWGVSNVLTLGSIHEHSIGNIISITLLDLPKKHLLIWEKIPNEGIEIQLPVGGLGPKNSNWGWTIAITFKSDEVINGL